MAILKKYIKSLNPEAFSIYNTFKQKRGSEHISSPVGINVLIDIVIELQPKSILEVGGGIGALSYTALKYSNAHVDIFEDHPFCLSELKKNLKGFENRYTLLTDYENFTLPRDSYDLVIIDGGGHYFIYNLISACRHVGRIFIEGGRAEQRKQARRALRQQYLFRPIQYTHSDGEYKGAHQIICCRNNNPLLRHIAYWFWEIVIFSEIWRSLVYHSRKILKRIYCA